MLVERRIWHPCDSKRREWHVICRSDRVRCILWITWLSVTEKSRVQFCVEPNLQGFGRKTDQSSYDNVLEKVSLYNGEKNHSIIKYCCRSHDDLLRTSLNLITFFEESRCKWTNLLQFMVFLYFRYVGARISDRNIIFNLPNKNVFYSKIFHMPCIVLARLHYYS